MKGYQVAGGSFFFLPFHSPCFHGHFQRKATDKRMHSSTLQKRGILKGLRGISKCDANCQVIEAEVVQGADISKRFGDSECIERQIRMDVLCSCIDVCSV